MATNTSMVRHLLANLDGNARETVLMVSAPEIKSAIDRIRKSAAQIRKYKASEAIGIVREIQEPDVLARILVAETRETVTQAIEENPHYKSYEAPYKNRKVKKLLESLQATPENDRETQKQLLKEALLNQREWQGVTLEVCLSDRSDKVSLLCDTLRRSTASFRTCGMVQHNLTPEELALMKTEMGERTFERLIDGALRQNAPIRAHVLAEALERNLRLHDRTHYTPEALELLRESDNVAARKALIEKGDLTQDEKVTLHQSLPYEMRLELIHEMVQTEPETVALMMENITYGEGDYRWSHDLSMLLDRNIQLSDKAQKNLLAHLWTSDLQTYMSGGNIQSPTERDVLMIEELMGEETAFEKDELIEKTNGTTSTEKIFVQYCQVLLRNIKRVPTDVRFPQGTMGDIMVEELRDLCQDNALAWGVALGLSENWEGTWKEYLEMVALSIN